MSRIRTGVDQLVELAGQKRSILRCSFLLVIAFLAPFTLLHAQTYYANGNSNVGLIAYWALERDQP